MRAAHLLLLQKTKKQVIKFWFCLELKPFTVSLMCLGGDPLQTDPRTSLWLWVERFSAHKHPFP